MIQTAVENGNVAKEPLGWHLSHTFLQGGSEFTGRMCLRGGKPLRLGKPEASRELKREWFFGERVPRRGGRGCLRHIAGFLEGRGEAILRGECASGEGKRSV